MFKSLSALLLLAVAAIPAMAGPKEYRDAEFVGTEAATDGTACNGDIDQWGSISERCKPVYVMHYKVALDGSVYTLRRITDHPNRAMFVNMPDGTGVLGSTSMLKGATVKIRINDKDLTAYVKVGNKESRYRIVPRTVRQ